MQEARFLHPSKSLPRRGDQPGQTESFGGERSNQSAAARTERDLHKRSVPPPCAPQPEMRVRQRGPGLGAEAHASEIRPGERTGVGCVQTA